MRSDLTFDPPSLSSNLESKADCVTQVSHSLDELIDYLQTLIRDSKQRNSSRNNRTMFTQNIPSMNQFCDAILDTRIFKCKPYRNYKMCPDRDLNLWPTASSNQLHRAVRNGKEAKNSKWKFMDRVGFEPVYHSHNKPYSSLWLMMMIFYISGDANYLICNRHTRWSIMSHDNSYSQL